MFKFVYKDIDFSHKLDYASSPEDEYNKHMHSFYELFLFVRGDVNYHVEGDVKKLQIGDIILMNPGTYHFALVNHDIQYERYVLKFPISFVPSNIQERLKEAYPFFSTNHFVENTIRELDELNELFTDNEDIYTICKCKLTEALVYLANQAKGSHEFVSQDLNSILVNYIQTHIKEDLTLTKISSDLHYSESYLSNTFKKVMKCPLMKYIRSKKILLAQQMINSGRKAIDVCEELSFNDYSTFYRTYVKITGSSPKDDKSCSINKKELQ